VLNPVPTVEAVPWSQRLPPNGVWQVDETIDDFVELAILRSKVAELESTITKDKFAAITNLAVSSTEFLS
jgi:hypothetical protein